MGNQSAIIALRGAGSVGGIDREAADRVVEKLLIPEIERTASERPVAIMYDGDTDNPDKPDIGYIFGRLRDRFNTSDGAVSFLIAQTLDWYKPIIPGANLTNFHGLPSDTYVIPKELGHSDFTQSEALAAYPLYRQIYVGAAGTIATQQMVDYSGKIPPGGETNITIVRALIGQTRSLEIGRKLAQASTQAEKDQLAQTERLYGPHWDNQGQLNPAP